MKNKINMKPGCSINFIIESFIENFTTKKRNYILILKKFIKLNVDNFLKINQLEIVNCN